LAKPTFPLFAVSFPTYFSSLTFPTGDFLSGDAFLNPLSFFFSSPPPFFFFQLSIRSFSCPSDKVLTIISLSPSFPRLRFLLFGPPLCCLSFNFFELQTPDINPFFGLPFDPFFPLVGPPPLFPRLLLFWFWFYRPPRCKSCGHFSLLGLIPLRPPLPNCCGWVPRLAFCRF